MVGRTCGRGRSSHRCAEPVPTGSTRRQRNSRCAARGRLATSGRARPCCPAVGGRVLVGQPRHRSSRVSCRTSWSSIPSTAVPAAAAFAGSGQFSDQCAPLLGWPNPGRGVPPPSMTSEIDCESRRRVRNWCAEIARGVPSNDCAGLPCGDRPDREGIVVTSVRDAVHHRADIGSDGPSSPVPGRHRKHRVSPWFPVLRGLSAWPLSRSWRAVLAARSKVNSVRSRRTTIPHICPLLPNPPRPAMKQRSSTRRSQLRIPVVPPRVRPDGRRQGRGGRRFHGRFDGRGR